MTSGVVALVPIVAPATSGSNNRQDNDLDIRTANVSQIRTKVNEGDETCSMSSTDGLHVHSEKSSSSWIRFYQVVPA